MKIMLGLLLWLTLGFSGVTIASKLKPKEPIPLGAVVLISAFGPLVFGPVLGMLLESVLKDSKCALNCK